MSDISRSLTEMQADVISVTPLYNDNITTTDTISFTKDFLRMGTFTLWIIPVLNDGGTAPATLSIEFVRKVRGYIASGSSFTKTIAQADIVSSPVAQLVNVSDFKPSAVFEDLEIRITSSDPTDVNLKIYVVGD